MKKIIINLLLWLLWKLSDDAVSYTDDLDELYFKEDIPEGLGGESVEVHTFHFVCDDDKRDEIKEWLKD